MHVFRMSKETGYVVLFKEIHNGVDNFICHRRALHLFVVNCLIRKSNFIKG